MTCWIPTKRDSSWKSLEMASSSTELNAVVLFKDTD